MLMESEESESTYLAFAIHVTEQEDAEYDSHLRMISTQSDGPEFLIRGSPCQIVGRSSCEIRELIFVPFGEAALLKGMIQEIRVANELSIYSAVQNKSRDLQEAYLEGISGSNFHGQGDVAVHGKRNGILWLD